MFGLAVGSGTLLGGIMAYLFKTERKIEAFLLGASSGIGIAVSLTALLPASLSLGGIGYSVLGFLLGGIVLAITDAAFPHSHCEERYGDRLYMMLKAASLIAVGIIIHDFPEGLAIGAGLASSAKLGIAVALALAFHNIPEGISIVRPLLGTSMKRSTIMLLPFISVIVTVVASVLMFLVMGNAAPVLLASGLAFSAGAMLYISLTEVIPQMKRARRQEIAISLFIGLVIGFLILGF